VSLVDGELDSHPVDPFCPNRGHFLGPRGSDAASLRLYGGDLDSGVSEVERLPDRDVLLWGEFEGCSFGLVEAGHDEGDLDCVRLPRDHRRYAAAVRTLHRAFEDDLVFAADL